MIEAGEPGHIINTSSGDGGIAPVPRASVYASSKAALSCFTEALDHQLIAEGTQLRASVFYPSGGLMNTGLFNAQRNRPAELARERGGTGRPSMTFEQLQEMMSKGGREVPVADLDDLGRFVVEAVRERRYIIGHALDETAELLHRRADAIERAELPPHHGIEF
jgi:short-subunit dehydrogenase